MVIGLLADPALRAALLRAASPEEDVVLGQDSAFAAVQHGFPRILVLDEENERVARWLIHARGMDRLLVTQTMVRAWDEERRRAEIFRRREDFAVDRLRALLAGRRRMTWIDRVFRDVSKASGAQLPRSLRAFGRRVLEFPPAYHDLHALTPLTGLSRGALKARFRRRGLASPSAYLRWFRMMAAAHVLRDPTVSTLQASYRLGFTSDGNFCRAVITTTGLTPTDLRSSHGWDHLVVRFSERFLSPASLEDWIDAWDSFDGLFLDRSRAA